LFDKAAMVFVTVVIEVLFKIKLKVKVNNNMFGLKGSN